MTMPTRIFIVIGSLNAIAPIRIAVTGSNTPKTDALVGPILRVARANEAVETTVGRIANPNRLSHAVVPSIPVIIEESPKTIFNMNIMQPTKRE